MVFSSLFFVYVFLPICMLLYFLAPNIKLKNAVLIVFSLIFYSWGEPTFVLLMIATVAVNYVLGLLIGKFQGKWPSKLFLAISVICLLGSLGVFKYAGFAVESVNSLLGTTFTVPDIKLPIGISFYTFQILTYVIDVYRGVVPSQKSPFRLFMYIACFHQLIAGPIVRYDHIAAEIEERSATQKDIAEGIERFIIGFGKKVILANMCGTVASDILDGSVNDLTVVGSWLGIIMYSMQIYFDFSAYSDMAIGLGRMCGFHYRENFDYPYVSRSVTEFWRRWHISLGSFFRDYVYIPLGGNRKHQFLNLLVVWFLTGLWHGASWNFVIWGLYYFVFIALEKFVYGKFLKKLPIISNIYLLVIVIVGWVFFYFTDITKAFEFIKTMFGFTGARVIDGMTETQLLNNAYLIAAGVICCLPILKYLSKARNAISERTSGGLYSVLSFSRYAICYLVLFAIFAISSILLVGESYNPFLYFRF